MRADAHLIERARSYLAEVLPAETDSHLRNPLPSEIAHRFGENMQFVDFAPKLRDQFLIVLADYRNHAWAGKTLRSESERIRIVDFILDTNSDDDK